MIWPRRRLDTARIPSVHLTGERVTVRPPRAEDWRSWAEVRSRNRAMLEPLEPRWPENCLTREFFSRRLARQMQDWQRGQSCSFLIFETSSQTLIGGVNINNIARGAAQHASLGYWLDQAFQGRGYMREALTLVIDFGFSALKLHRFNAGCLSGNERSAGVLLRLGFKEEGFAEKYVQIDGQWQDHRLFGLPAEHWPPSE
ncbi:MAG: GNAT family N-acetyltransferase [Rhodospirillales bacterium]|nr:GNAT family N-acetyltransferase [Rhodospirillales bacterium]MCB9997170.1 GNAT family N-acetyltransferase [Rhodospirillales bacterium]